MDPYWMYKLDKNGVVESKLFTTKTLPKGWSDNPKKAAKKEPEKVVEKVIETPIIEPVEEITEEAKLDGDGTGLNKLFS